MASSHELPSPTPRCEQPLLTASGTPDETWLAKGEVQAFLKSKEGSSLKAWLHHFDTNHDQRISRYEFATGMAKLNYAGNASALFDSMDADHSGYLSLEEVDVAQALLWRKFRMWCSARFPSFRPMAKELLGDAASLVKITRDPFVSGLRRLGWNRGCEDLLFDSLCNDQGAITEKAMLFLELESRRVAVKQQAKAGAVSQWRRNAWEEKVVVRHEFMQFLKHKYGSYVRAWRVGLSPVGAVGLRKMQFFKACVNLGWQRSVRLLWKSFDKDDYDYLSMEELDLASAEHMAMLRAKLISRFGTCVAAFRALDQYYRRGVRQKEFVDALASADFPSADRLGVEIFQGLDSGGCGRLTEEDFVFLDNWNPLEYMLASPNQQAMEEFKAKLLDHYRTYLRAWRRALDTDNSNRCTWNEFVQACKKVEFSGDVPGAWRALDNDFSGYISLHEIDSAASKILLDFRKWADREFGGVRSAFGVFDADRSCEVSYAEFSHSCRIYGFEGNVHSLFRALDVERNGTLTLHEIAFLDEWSSQQLEEDEAEERRGSKQDASKRLSFWSDAHASLARSSTVGTDDPAPLPRNRAADALVALRRSLKPPHEGGGAPPSFFGAAGSDSPVTPLAIPPASSSRSKPTSAQGVYEQKLIPLGGLEENLSPPPSTARLRGARNRLPHSSICAAVAEEAPNTAAPKGPRARTRPSTSTSRGGGGRRRRPVSHTGARLPTLDGELGCGFGRRRAAQPVMPSSILRPMTYAAAPEATVASNTASWKSLASCAVSCEAVEDFLRSATRPFFSESHAAESDLGALRPETAPSVPVHPAIPPPPFQYGAGGARVEAEAAVALKHASIGDLMSNCFEVGDGVHMRAMPTLDDLISVQQGPRLKGADAPRLRKPMSCLPLLKEALV